jgi:hypothetical protein
MEVKHFIDCNFVVEVANKDLADGFCPHKKNKRITRISVNPKQHIF